MPRGDNNLCMLVILYIKNDTPEYNAIKPGEVKTIRLFGYTPGTGLNLVPAL